MFIGSKNAFAASPGAAAYCTAKAAELHLARCPRWKARRIGIRVNVVNPDAVLRGSRIWQGEWATQRAAQNKTSVDNLETVYRDRSLLKRSVYPEDVAEAVAFFARAFRQIDGQYRERRCRQRRRVHSLRNTGRSGSRDHVHRTPIRATRTTSRPPTSHTWPRCPRTTPTWGRARTPRRGHRRGHQGRREFQGGHSFRGVGTGGTRFGRFPGPGEPRNVFESSRTAASSTS